MSTRNDEKWLDNYKALEAYIDKHHHLPPKDSGLNAKYLLNWVKYQRKRMKANLIKDDASNFARVKKR